MKHKPHKECGSYYQSELNLYDNQGVSENSSTSRAFQTKCDDLIVARALAIVERRLSIAGAVLNSPSTVRDYLTLTIAGHEHEVFMVVFLNAQHQVIHTEQMFRGTLTQTSVYPREVVKRSLALNASAVIFAHNHPSGVGDPSQSDRLLTDALKHALSLVDVRVLDHFIIAGISTFSFAERGLL
jgi:DNA repair protein RadC